MKRVKSAVLICFSIQSGKFESNYERNRFFRDLYGWKQIVRRIQTTSGKRVKKRTYTYRRIGLLDEIPHEKIDQSSFIVPEREFEKVERFFKAWRNKVIWRAFKVLLDENLEKLLEGGIDV